MNYREFLKTSSKTAVDEYKKLQNENAKLAGQLADLSRGARWNDTSLNEENAALKLKIEIEVSEENEGTSYPWWIIIDTWGNMNPQDCITGPFFSRESAQLRIDKNRHRYSKSAYVYCMSGCFSHEWCDAMLDGESRK